MSKYSKTLEILNSKTDISYYILGAFVTDGNICIDKSCNGAKCSLSSNDSDWISSIHNLIGNEGSFRYRKDGRAELWLYSHDVYNWFNENGCPPKKSLTLKMPDVPDKFLPDFVRGCIDGDGSISSSPYQKFNKDKTKAYNYIKSTCYICSASDAFLPVLNERLVKFGFNPTFVKLKSSSGTSSDGRVITPKQEFIYRISFGDKSAAKFLDWAYYKDHKISMPRKNSKAKEIIERLL